MIQLKSEIESVSEVSSHLIPTPFHASFSIVYRKLQKWIARFTQNIDNSVFNDLLIFYLVTPKKFLDHRNPSHLFRLILSIAIIQRKLLRSSTFLGNQRHLEFRWIPTSLVFPFSSRPVLGCLIAFNALDKYELFDEENVILALQKQLPDLRLVKESFYHHTSQNKEIKTFYFEIEKKDGIPFTLKEKFLLKNNLDEKVKNSIQMLSPAFFIGNNEEEIYKKILVLSQEIQFIHDLPQASINLDQQTGKEIVFHVTLVYISPFHRFSLKDCFRHCTFISQRILNVKQVENHQIEAHIFNLHLPRDVSLLRADGSLDFYSARQRVVNLIKGAIGEFRDYNGGIIIKQQEMLQSFKERFPEIAEQEPSIIETFFYALMPLEKQAVLDLNVLSELFSHFLKNRDQKILKDLAYSFDTYQDKHQLYLTIKCESQDFKNVILNFLKERSFKSLDIAYSVIKTSSEVFFNCVFLKTNADNVEFFIQNLCEHLNQWQAKLKDKQTLRIALEYKVVSLDPRIGGEVVSADILNLLFEGLTRYDQNDKIENAIAESIEISSDYKIYIFKIRNCLWNDGSQVSAYDFEYAWKKILSPKFKTAFADLFYPIKNAKLAKEGKVSLDEVGIYVENDRTLKVELERPLTYFLQLTALPLFSPIHRHMDQQHPQWPYQSKKNYPCNGPYELEFNQPNQAFQLVKNDFYWDVNKIILDKINLTLMNPNQAIWAFKRQEIDWIGNPFGTWHPSYNEIELNNDNRLVSYPNNWVCWLVFNTSLPPLNNLKLRKAFSYVIQRNAMIKDNYLSLKPAFDPILPYQEKNHHFLFPEHDAQKARDLFNEALVELALDKNGLSPLTLIYHEKGFQQYIVHHLKQQFKEFLDLDCILKPLPWNTIFANMSEGDFEIGLMSWTSWIDDPIYTLNAFNAAAQKTNFAKWEHTEFQHYIHLSQNEINPFLRSSYLLEAEKILCREMPIIPLYYQPVQALVKKNLRIFYNNPCSPFYIARFFHKKGDPI